ncbi:hypothetical protein BU17DRAFT_104038 [Hysterangium stoloniferum]|nr:hypothetical protein BU17DRAFT_104111 [Hysterangium stoloniferum]KAF8491679.1 hypothetical protein BU17DRAFT_104038 [Hysterangium stoloniferum]
MNNIDELQQLSPSSPVQRERREYQIEPSTIDTTPCPSDADIEMLSAIEYLRDFFKPNSNWGFDSTQVPAPMQHRPTPFHPPSGLSHLARYDSMGISSPVGSHLGHFSHMPAILYNGMNDNAMHDYAQQASSTHRRGSFELHSGSHPKSTKLSRTYRYDPIRRHGSRQGSARASITAARATRPPETFSQTSGLAIGIDGGSPTSWTPPLSLDISSTLLHPSRGREIFWTPGDDEMENEVSPGSQELSAVVLVGKVFDTSAGQIFYHEDLEPSLEKQLGNTSGSGRKSNSQADGEASVKPIALPYGPSSPPPPPPPESWCSLPTQCTSKRREEEQPLRCPWGGVRYGVNGEVLPCTLTSNDVKYGKVLQHWAWQHVTNEASAIRRGIISMDNAQIVDTQEKLDGAVFHLGLCPNPQCWNESQMRLSSNKPGVIATHLKTHEECKRFFPGTIAKWTGYKEMRRLLGYVYPLLPMASDVLPVGGRVHSPPDLFLLELAL